MNPTETELYIQKGLGDAAMGKVDEQDPSDLQRGCITTGEVWVPIQDAPDYRVSTLGTIQRLVKGKYVTLVPRKCNHNQMYRSVYVAGNKKRGGRFVHRLVIESFIGPRPEGMECLHKNGIGYDNRLCNLRWGTRQENVDDRRLHGTNTVGEKHPKAILTEQSVMEMRKLAAEGATITQLGKMFGVCNAAAAMAINGTNWKHLPNPVPKAKSSRKYRRLSVESVRAIRELYGSGRYTYKALGELYSVSKHTIRRIVKRWSRKDVEG